MRTHTIEQCLDTDIEYEFWNADETAGSRDNEQLVQSDYEHIQGLLRDGYYEGELVHEDCQGWWKIKK